MAKRHHKSKRRHMMHNSMNESRDSMYGHMREEPAIGEHSSMREGRYSIERGGTNRGMRVMNTNNGNRGAVREDFSRPCGLPYGAIQREMGQGNYYSMNAFRVGDLFEQVDKSMREDAAGIKAITRPTNW